MAGGSPSLASRRVRSSWLLTLKMILVGLQEKFWMISSGTVQEILLKRKNPWDLLGRGEEEPTILTGTRAAQEKDRGEQLTLRAKEEAH